MKITEQDIVRTAQQLRDEENEQLHVRPFFHHTPMRRLIPTWLVAVPAAAVIGFVFGLWTKGPKQEDSQITALTDTVYITVPEPLRVSDSTAIPAVPATAVAPSSGASQRQTPRRRKTIRVQSGKSVADDQIRYDLLVKN